MRVTGVRTLKRGLEATVLVDTGDPLRPRLEFRTTFSKDGTSGVAMAYRHLLGQIEAEAIKALRGAVEAQEARNP